MTEKMFLVRDEGGRGVAVTLPLAEVLERWDAHYSNDPEDEFEATLGEWLEHAEVGDAYLHRDDNVSFTRTE